MRMRTALFDFDGVIADTEPLYDRYWNEAAERYGLGIPNFADLSMKSSDPYGRDLDQWPLWRLEGAAALMEHVRNFTACVRARGVTPCLAFYMHPWEFHPMPEGLLHYGEGAVLPDPFIVKNCGPYAVEQFDLLLKLLKESGVVFRTARELADETPLTE